MATPYLDPDSAPTREDVDRMPGLVLLEFGTDWCGFCRAAQPHVATLLGERRDVRHVKVEDGPGRKLGRSFAVRLWPNFVLLKDGVVIRQLARPSANDLKEAFAELNAG